MNWSTSGKIIVRLGELPCDDAPMPLICGLVRKAANHVKKDDEQVEREIQWRT
jgi:hypothetical protein